MHARNCPAVVSRGGVGDADDERLGVLRAERAGAADGLAVFTQVDETERHRLPRRGHLVRTRHQERLKAQATQQGFELVMLGAPGHEERR
jgi:hypothetical protein